MTLDEFKEKITVAKRANLEDIEKVRKFNQENGTDESWEYEDGYGNALNYVLKLLEEVK